MTYGTDSKSGVHLMLQTRTRVLDGTLKSKFNNWSPGLYNGALDISLIPGHVTGGKTL